MEKKKCENCMRNPVKNPVTHEAFHLLKKVRIGLCERCCSKLCLMGTIKEVVKIAN